MDDLPAWVLYFRAMAPTGAFAAATVAAWLAWRGHVRQTRTDLDERFWRRLTWAMERVGASDVYEANMGMIVLNELRTDQRVEKQEEDMLMKLVETVYARVDDGRFAGSGKRSRRTLANSSTRFVQFLQKIVK
ncbi:MAG TPA: hypothetical protein VK065_04260 [Brevibacterium sp.]|nr:hypothetical protein [Brevibacterium sp.]